MNKRRALVALLCAGAMLGGTAGAAFADPDFGPGGSARRGRTTAARSVTRQA